MGHRPGGKPLCGLLSAAFSCGSPGFQPISRGITHFALSETVQRGRWTQVGSALGVGGGHRDVGLGDYFPIRQGADQDADVSIEQDGLPWNYTYVDAVRALLLGQYQGRPSIGFGRCWAERQEEQERESQQELGRSQLAGR